MAISVPWNYRRSMACTASITVAVFSQSGSGMQRSRQKRQLGMHKFLYKNTTGTCGEKTLHVEWKIIYAFPAAAFAAICASRSRFEKTQPQ